MQLIIPQDLSLPIYIEEVNINLPARAKGGERCIIKSNIEKISDGLGIGSASIIKGDMTICEIKQCNLKILQTLPDKPSANDLVEPSKRDQNLIYEKLKLLFDEFKFKIPLIKCLHDSRLIGATKKERHKIELPIMKQSIQEVLKNGEKRKFSEIEIKWAKSGKPIAHCGGKTKENIGLSVSHDGPFLMVTAGYGTQGCDVQHVKQRTASDWLALLGSGKNELLKELVGKGSDINEAGTTIWCAIETMRKFKTINEFDLKLIDQYKSLTVFRSNVLEETDQVIVFPITLTRNDMKMMALIVGSKEVEKISPSSKNERIKTLIDQFGYNEKVFGIAVDDKGPQGQFVYVQKFPITFKSSQSLSRRVYFTNYFNWIGEMREHGMYPIMKKISHMAESGGWGLSTNSVKTQILGELGSHDVVEVRLWLARISGDMQATFDLDFEWRRVIDDGKYERVALSALRATWIQITGHGEAKIGVLPDFIRNFMDAMKPKRDANRNIELLPEPLRDFSLGEKILSFSGDLLKRPLLHEEIFQTTLEDSNLVGNIYFVNYSKWLGRTLDLYFYKFIPEYFKGIGAQGELICLNCEIEHLREAMPFDKILVRMYLESVYECGINLYFEYFRLDKDYSEIKLAFARHKAVWVKRDEGSKAVAAKLPPLILKALENFRILKIHHELINIS